VIFSGSEVICTCLFQNDSKWAKNDNKIAKNINSHTYFRAALKYPKSLSPYLIVLWSGPSKPVVARIKNLVFF
jgi:hypothetical protein